MSPTLLRGWPVLIALLLHAASASSAQTVHAEAGVGPTTVPGEGRGNRNWFGAVGYQSAGAFGVRVSGAETASRLWLTVDGTWRTPGGEPALRPYALLGLGYVVDLNEGDALVSGGAGIRVRLSRSVFAFGEVRVQRILGTPASGPRTILPLTVGIGVGR